MLVAAFVTGFCALVGCGDTTSCQGFALSLVEVTGGASSAVAAADQFAENSDEFDRPGDGWRAGVTDVHGVEVLSGTARLHAVQGSDRTWFIDGGRTGACD